MVWKSYCSNCLHLNTWWQERRWAFWHKSVEHEIDLWTSVSTSLYITAGSHHTNALLNVTIQRFLTEKSWRTQSASTHPSMKHSWTDGCFLDDRESTSLQITETLTLQSLAYVQEEERKIWAADELKLLLIVSRRLCQLSSTVSLLHRTGFIVGAAQGFFELWEQWHKLRLTESVLHLLDLHSSQIIKIVVIHCFVTPAQMIIEFVNLSKVYCKNDSIKISFCEFPKVIVCLKLLIYVL